MKPRTFFRMKKVEGNLGLQRLLERILGIERWGMKISNTLMR
jgi:hypothetical protein